jgi:hypothetical protein
VNPVLAFIVLLLALGQLFLPRKLRFLPLLIAICHLPNGAVFGGDFSAGRIVIGVGVISAILRGELKWSFKNSADRWMVVFAAVALLTSFGHEKSEDTNPQVFALGLIYNFVGGYVYVRSYLPALEDLRLFAEWLVIVLTPLALLMSVQKITQSNPYSVLGGGITAVSNMREGKVRAQGPFAHPILAGTVGASSIPFLLILWREKQRMAKLGLGAASLVTLTSASSGPIMTLVAGVGALMLWNVREHLPLIRRTAVLSLLVLHFSMKAPVWYLMARIDLTGSSTGWHRAELITSALKHFSEWWLVGTDYTVHWMPTGVSWSPNHTDITNHYLQMGVVGGVALMLVFILILRSCFRLIGVQLSRFASTPYEFYFWCVGAVLFAHSFTFLSVSYFDQSGYWITFALGIAALGGRDSEGDTAGEVPNSQPVYQES